MQLSRLPRVLALVACVLAAAGFGSLVAYTGARLIALSYARAELDAHAENLLSRATTIAREVDHSLDQANRIQAAACSAEDISDLREIAFRTRFVKDVGRIVDNHLACSSFLGTLPDRLPIDFRPAELETPTGRRLWTNVPLRLVPDLSAIVVVTGTSNIVIDPAAFLDLERPPFRYSIAMINQGQRRVLRSWGERILSDEVILAGNASRGTEDDLTAVRCSPAYAICSVAALSRTFAAGRDARFVYGLVLSGGMAGGGLGLAWAAFLRRQKPLAARLSAALRADELTVVYQPIVDLGTGRMVSAEALLRWVDRDGDAIPPEAFVAEAERTGIVGDVTAYVLRKVIAQCGPLLREHPDLVVTINIAAADLEDPRFYALLARMLSVARLPARQLGLELTERSTTRLDIAVPAVARLRQLGHHVYLDDFGTGFSSLANLQELSIDVIKIDRAFTKTVGTGSVKVSIVPQILDMAKALGVSVVVEGVETAEQCDYFAAAMPGCAGQGWFVARPLTPEQLKAFHAGRPQPRSARSGPVSSTIPA